MVENHKTKHAARFVKPGYMNLFHKMWNTFCRDPGSNKMCTRRSSTCCTLLSTTAAVVKQPHRPYQRTLSTPRIRYGFRHCSLIMMTKCSLDYKNDMMNEWPQSSPSHRTLGRITSQEWFKVHDCSQFWGANPSIFSMQMCRNYFHCLDQSCLSQLKECS